jgi:hypothetical protein
VRLEARRGENFRIRPDFVNGKSNARDANKSGRKPKAEGCWR